MLILNKVTAHERSLTTDVMKATAPPSTWSLGIQDSFNMTLSWLGSCVTDLLSEIEVLLRKGTSVFSPFFKKVLVEIEVSSVTGISSAEFGLKTFLVTSTSRECEGLIKTLNLFSWIYLPLSLENCRAKRTRVLQCRANFNVLTDNSLSLLFTYKTWYNVFVCCTIWNNSALNQEPFFHLHIRWKFL